MKGSVVFWALLALGAVFVAITLPTMPTIVATNFNGVGAPHAWMGRGSYAIYLSAVGIVLPLGMVGLMGRRAPTRESRWWLGSLMIGFALGVHVLLLGAHRRQPPHLSTVSFLTAMGVFVVGLIAWVVHWRGGRSPGQSSW